MRRKLLSIPVRMGIILPIVFLCASEMFAAPKAPNFSGKWELDAAKSVFGDFLPLSKLSDQIEQTSTELTIHRLQSNGGREVRLEIVYKFGDEAVAKLPTGESRTLARWEGSVLVVELDLATSIHLHVIDRWSLLRGGRTLRIDRQYGNAAGSIRQRLVLQKQ